MSIRKEMYSGSKQKKLKTLKACIIYDPRYGKVRDWKKKTFLKTAYRRMT